eukprot:Phypoly_transcript_01503.p1 GENE.Phypoly_transcript_01503~~Phypoly_transcript_01503.p1  ORF type:complete len:1035 (+),score=194.99 Phypoly_transcript_01503:188-3292(+)
MASPKSPPFKDLNTLVKHYGKVSVDPKQKKICEDSGLDSLLNLVSMPQVKVQSLATEVINSLAEGDNDEVSVTSEEAFRNLVRLTQFPEEDVQREAVWSLAILASNSSCRVRIEQEVGWHNFRKYASSPVPEIQAGTAILLGNLALDKKTQEVMMQKGTPLLLEMLNSSDDPKVRRAVVTALSNVSIIEDFGAKELWSEKGLELIVPFIRQEEDPQLQIGALNTIANICNHDDPDLKQKVVELGGLGCLVPLLDNHDEMIVKLAAMTIANMASEEEHRKVLRDLSVVEPLVRLLDSRDDEVQLGVAMAINALAHNETIRKEFRERQAAEALVELIRLTKDKDIIKEAKAALKKISPEDYAALQGSRDGSDSSYSDSESATHTGSDSESRSYDSENSHKSGRSHRSNRSARSKSGDETHSHSETDHSERSERSGSDDDRSERSNRSDRSNGSRNGHKRGRAGSAVEATKKRNAELEDEERERKEEEHDRQKLAELDLDPSLPGKQRSEEVRGKRPEHNEDRGRGMSVDSTLSDEARSGALSEEDPHDSNAARVREEELRAKRIEQDRKSAGYEAAGISSEEALAREERLRERDRQREELLRERERERQRELEEREREERDRRRGSRRDSRGSLRGSPRPPSSRINRDEIDEEARRRSKGKQPVRDESASDTDSGGSEDEDIPPPHQSRRDEPMHTPSMDPGANPAFELVNLLQQARNKQGVSKKWLRDIERFSGLSPKSQLHRGEDIIPILVYIIYFYPDVNYPDIVSLALYILALLGRYHVSNQVAIKKAKGGEQIQRLLASNVQRVQRNAALSLGAYSLNNTPIQIESSRAIPQLLLILEGKETPPVTRKAVAACLVSLVDNNKHNQDIVLQHNGLRVAIKLGESQDYIRPTLHLVAAIVSRNVNAQNVVILEHTTYIVALLTMLSVQPRTMHPFVTNTIVELARKNPRVQFMLFLNGAIDKLVPLLTDGSEQTVVNTLFILYTLSKNRKNGSKIRETLRALNISAVLRNLSVSADRETSEIATSLAKALDKK